MCVCVCVKRRHTQIPTGSVMHLRIESRCIVVSLQSHCDFLEPRKLYSAERRWTQLASSAPPWPVLLIKTNLVVQKKGIAEEATGCCHRGFSPPSNFPKCCKNQIYTWPCTYAKTNRQSVGFLYSLMLASYFGLSCVFSIKIIMTYFCKGSTSRFWCSSLTDSCSRWWSQGFLT